MKNNLNGLIIILLLLTFIGKVAAEDVPEDTVYGHVYDATKHPLPQAFVYCQEEMGCNKPTTNKEGYYAFNQCLSPSKFYTIVCTKFGYETTKKSISTDPEGKANVDFFLQKEGTDSDSDAKGALPSQQYIKSANVGIQLWNKTFGGSGYDFAWSVDQTNDGGYIVTGETSSFGAGNSDIWLIKTDTNGNKLWDRTFGGPNSDGGRSVEQTSDGGYIVTGQTSSFGAGNSDIWLIKTDTNGNKLWDRTFGGLGEDRANSAHQTSDGGYIVTGLTSSFGAGNSDIWLIKTDANGDKVWERTFSESVYDAPGSIQQTSDGGYIIACSSSYIDSTIAGVWDAWLIKTDSSGNKLWDRTFGGFGNDQVSFVKQTSDNGYIISGETDGAGEKKVWLIKTDSAGNKQWDKTFGGGAGMSVQQATDGGYIIAGYTTSYGAGGEDALLIKTNANGN